MKNVFIVTLFLFSAASLAAQERAKQPNIILVFADDLGYGDVGCYGQQKIQTPNIDKLAKMGMRFTQFYAGSTVCAPSRSTLMTGLHTGHTAIRGNKTLKPEGQVPLPDSIITLAMLLKKGGYRTGAFGKWSLGFITTSGDPALKGFDEFYGYNCQTLAHNYYPDHLWHNHDRIDLSGNLYKDSVYSADLIHRQAIDFIKSGDKRPFFLYLPYTLPHADVIVPHDSIYNFYVKKFAEKPVTVKSTDREQHHYDPYPHAAFAAMVARLDRYLGEIMRVLKEKGLEENTLIIFTSDNGPHRENGGDPDFFNSNGGLKGIKRDLYEGGIRVPFIAAWKGVIKSDTVNDQPAALWDLYPSFLEMAGLPVTKGIDGISLLPSFKGKEQQRLDYFYWELHESGGKQAVRMGNWKGIKLNVTTEADSPIELYDLVNDPQEKNNVADRYPAVVKRIAQIMKEAHVRDSTWPLLVGE